MALTHKKGSHVFFYTTMFQNKQKHGTCEAVKFLQHSGYDLCVISVDSIGQTSGFLARICQVSQFLTSSSEILIIILPHHLSHHYKTHCQSLIIIACLLGSTSGSPSICPP